MARRGDLSGRELSLLKAKITDEEAWTKYERDCNIRIYDLPQLSFIKLGCL